MDGLLTHIYLFDLIRVSTCQIIGHASETTYDNMRKKLKVNHLTWLIVKSKGNIGVSIRTIVVIFNTRYS